MTKLNLVTLKNMLAAPTEQELIEFIEIEKIRVAKLYAVKHAKGFITRQEFIDWYCQQLDKQQCKCYYCDTSIFVIRKLIAAGALKTRKIKGDAVRGPVLEIDKVVNSKGYTSDNCVLACYWCNNDKSYTMDGESYNEHFGANRSRYHKLLTSIITYKLS